MAAFCAALTMSVAFTSCDPEQDPDTYLSNLKVSSSYVAIPVEGGTTSIEVTASKDWHITCHDTCATWKVEHYDTKSKKTVKLNEWLTIAPLSGQAGKSVIEFSAEQALDGRSAEVLLVLDDNYTSQRINVIQGLSVVSPVTCAEVLAGPDGKSFQVTGTVTNIANVSPYGNFYINDGTGEVYVYGTLDKDGKEKNSALSQYGIEVGDEVTVQGPKTTYNGTVELVNVTVVKVNKSLIKCDSTMVAGVKTDTLAIEGGIITAHLTNKGNNIFVTIPEDAQDWLSISAVEGNLISFKAAANEGGDRSTTLVFTTNDGKKDYTAKYEIFQKGAVAEVTCADFNAQADGTAQFKVRGVITKIASEKYGNLYINDGTGEVYVYGITDWANAGLKVGDEVLLQSVKASYKNAPQMKNAVVLEKIAHDTKTVADFLATEESKSVYYILRGAVAEAEGKTLAPYGNFNLVDATGTVYVYGVLNNLKERASKQFASLNVAVGDTITIMGYHTSYSGAAQVGGAIFIKNEKKAAVTE